MFLLKEISEKKKEKFYPQQIFNEVLALMMVYIHALMTKMAIRTCFINVIALVHKAKIYDHINYSQAKACSSSITFFKTVRFDWRPEEVIL